MKIFQKLITKTHKLLTFLILILILNTPVLCQVPINQIKSITWENNSLILNATDKITHAESRLEDPDRLIVDILNSSIQDIEINKSFKSTLGEKVSVSQVGDNQVRIIFLGPSSINRKSYLSNNNRTLIIKIARIIPEEDKVTENEEQSNIESYKKGELKEVTVEGDDNETTIIISATKPIKFNTYHLENPDRFAIDLLNIVPPENPLPKYSATSIVSGVRVGQAASGLDATRIVIDIAKENVDFDVDSSILGSKLKIKFKPGKKEEKIKSKTGIKVVIDPGHGGYDTGASYGGFEEKAINLIISEKLKNLLEGNGITVYLTRDEDDFLSLAERVEITNSIKPDAFISVHNNALKTKSSIRGAETYFWSPQSQKLAYLVHKSILRNINIPDHYIRKARFYVIRHTPSPAVLAELGFLSNYTDRQLLTNKSTQDKYANALAEAILKFLDIEPKQETTSQQDTMTAKETKNE